MNKTVREALSALVRQERVDSRALEKMLRLRPGPPPEVYFAVAGLVAAIHAREDAYK